MTSEQIRTKFIEFLKSKGHKEAPNASLIPVNDPSVLFTTAGMFPIVPYLLGQPHSLGKRLCNVQKCIRTNDIEEVGDTIHLTFFEMLGYWSLGDYFKKEALETSFEFFTSKEYIGFDPNRIYVSVFEGDPNTPLDNESIEIWKNNFSKVGINAEVWNKKDFNNDNLRIFPLNKKENWWGLETGPCGPDSEMFYWRGEGKPDFTKYVPWDSSGMFIEIGNDVFMEFNKAVDGTLTPLKQKNVDFGGGFERIIMISQFKKEDGSLPMSYSIYDTDLMQPIIKKIEELSGKKYSPSNTLDEETKAFRVVAEHARSATFILADGVKPANKDQGYILRRLIRRMVRFGMNLGLNENFTTKIATEAINKMKEVYPHLLEHQEELLQEMNKEETKFRNTIQTGLKEMRKMIQTEEQLNGQKAFYIYETFGFPVEMTLEEFNLSAEKKEQIFAEYDVEKKKHQDQSRAGAEQKFKGGLADQSEVVTKLHTTHHLLLKALQTVLGSEIKQRGSNITAERLRIDFNYGEKLTDEQVKQVEDIVNKAITDALPVTRIEMPREEAEKIGAEMEFGQKYPDIVSVYFIGIPENYFSAEFCGGPHVKNTSEIGGKFKIIKQENIGGGLRRIKAVLE